MSTPSTSSPSQYRRISSIDWSSKLGSFGEIAEGLDDIRQCIAVILGTQKGSVPHRPEFGCDLWKYIDLPVTAAKPRIIVEAMQALSRWEHRAVIESVTAEAQSDSHYLLTVNWHAANPGTAAADIIQEVQV